MMIKRLLGTTFALLWALLAVAQTDTSDTTEDTDSTETSETTETTSKLTFPNAFSPNGDGINDVFQAKVYENITEFHAYIFNRWGQKLYDWTDPTGSWDGTFQGKAVKDGVYFLLVKAKGGDGQDYNIRKDVNILRGYVEGTSY